MVQVAHSGANEEKIKEILLTAQKRFGMYGYGKTAMHEIAKDMGISKASLYYYYPDKESLFRAVFEKEKQEFIDQLHQAIDKSDNAEGLIYEFIDLRMKNLKSFINLGRASFDDIKGIRNIVKDLWLHFREKEKEEIKRILIKGVKSELFKILDSDDVASLFLDALRGLSHIYMKNKDISQLNDEDFRSLNNRVKQFAAIYIKGLMV
jgi:AcrR family transcriptional regulator